MSFNHIYCGNGKGKTITALGLALRTAGVDMNVHIIQFLKSSETAELKSLSEIKNISVARCSRGFGFTFQMTDEEKAEITEQHNKMLRDAKALISQGKIDMLILDEFLDAYSLGLVDRELADSIALRHYDSVELVITGRDPSDEYLAEADYVSEINSVKHPFEKGVQARKGIEY